MIKNKKYLTISIISLFIAAVAMALTAFSNVNSDGFQKIYTFFMAIVFWLAIITGYAVLILFYRKNKDIKVNGIPGILRFAVNKKSLVFDIAFAVAVILLIVFSVLNINNTFVYCMLFGIVFFSFNMRCIYNGRILNIDKIKSKGKLK